MSKQPISIPVSLAPKGTRNTGTPEEDYAFLVTLKEVRAQKVWEDLPFSKIIFANPEERETLEKARDLHLSLFPQTCNEYCHTSITDGKATKDTEALFKLREMVKHGVFVD